MKPILYAPNATNFNTQGLGVLSDCISCVVEQELSKGTNGIYELTMKYPFDGIHYSEIQQFSIIKARPYDNGTMQYFRVYKITEPLNGVCTINAEHISYQLNYLPVEPFTADTLAEAVSYLNGNTVLPSDFTVMANFRASAQLNFENQTNARAILGGGKGSILDRYGAEIEWNNYTVTIKKRLGLVRDIELRYGKNIVDIKQERNIQNLYTGISPYWKGQHISDEGKIPIQNEIDALTTQRAELVEDIAAQQNTVEYYEQQWRQAQATYGRGTKRAKQAKAVYDGANRILSQMIADRNKIDERLTQLQADLESVQPVITDTTVTLPEKVIYADNYEDFPYQRIRSLDFSQHFEAEPTETELREAANTWLLENPIGKPEVNIKVDFVPLWGTEEYKEIAPLERLYLGDTITVNFEKLGISETARVIAYKYDVLMERYEEIEIGDKKNSLAGTITDGNLVVADAVETISEYPSWIQSEIDRNSEMIKGGYGGYVVFGNNAAGQPEEIFIMDTPDIATATSVVRMNRNGIGFSMTGFEGPYNTAWTIDGHFDASYITAGVLNAVRIRAGILSDALDTPKNYWNLDTGEFHLDGSVTIGTGTDTLTDLQDEAAQALSDAGDAYDKAQGIITDASTGNLYISAACISAGTMSADYISGGTLDFANVTAANLNIVPSSELGSFKTTLSDGLATFYYDNNKRGTIGMANSTTIEISGLPSSSSSLSSDITIRTGQIISLIAGQGINLGVDTQPVYSLAIRDATALSGGTDLVIGATHGRLRKKSSSSRRFKHDIKEIQPEFDAAKLYGLIVRQFKYNADYLAEEDERYLKDVVGFIAEEVEEVYPIAVNHGMDGLPQDWDARYIIPPMLKLIQEQHEEIETLKSQMAAIEERLNKLEGANNG